jgi:predicted amidohydrolase YtcJ
VDLHGGTIVPGFIDAHAHPVFAGDQLRRCDLEGATTASGYAALVAAYARDHPDEEWITGGGWLMEAFPGGVATRDLLDACPLRRGARAATPSSLSRLSACRPSWPPTPQGAPG